MENFLNYDLLKAIAVVVIVGSSVATVPLIKSFRQIIKELKEPSKTVLHIKEKNKVNEF